MVTYFIYATDDSGSTNGVSYFNTKGLETLKSFQDDVKAFENNEAGDGKENRTVYLHWSDKCARVEEDEVTSRYKQENGCGSQTLPHTILDWIKQNLNKEDRIKLLYIITDGAVHSSNIKPCDPDMKIDTVKFYSFNRNINCIDMSVASMFICNNKRFIVYCNEELVDDTDLSTPFDYEKINIETFNESKEQLKSYIKLQFLCKKSSNLMALEEIKKLKRLRTRLFDELKALEAVPKQDTPINLNVKSKDIFTKEFKRTEFYKTLMNSNEYNEKQNIESSISTLINYINNDKKSFRFDNLKLTQKYTPTDKQEEVLEVDYENAEEISFPDIIMSNETGIPVILLTHYSLIEKILFKCGKQQMAHFSRFKSMIECPLTLLHDDKFKNSIEYYYNLDAFKSMIEHGIQTGPRTRQQFTGAIVPLEEFDDYNDYILSCTYFAGRRVPYNKGLFYYVIYKICEKLEYIEANVVAYLKGYIIKRIAKTECSLGLNTVSIDDPLIKVNLTTALWYCVELSSILFKNDPIHFTKEKMRMYSHFAGYMKEILAWFEYDIDTTTVELRADIFKHLNRLKRISRPEDKVILILEQIFKKKDGFLVAEIVKPSNIYKLNYLHMDHKKRVDVNALSVAVDIHKFAHFMDYVETTDVPVCKQTMRPHFVVEDKKSFYEQLMSKARKVVIENEKLTLEPLLQLSISRILPLYKLYISFVQQHLRYPTLEEYKSYVLEKKKYFRGKPVIFSTNTVVAIENIYARYEAIVTDQNNPIEVTKFIEIAKESANREKRIKLENPVDFNLAGVSDYIRNSEKNVIFV